MIYSRNAENLSSAYPDVIANVINQVDNKKDIGNFILDSELIPYDLEQDKILPFSVLCNRSRKHITAEDLKNKVCIYAFDLLFFNGEPLLKETMQ